MDAVSMSYGPLPVLSEVTIGLVRGGVTAVIGLPGSGKSTLLACATGRQTPTSGWVGRHDRIVTPDPVEWERLPAADRDRPELLVADDLEEAQHLYAAMDLEDEARTVLVTTSGGGGGGPPPRGGVGGGGARAPRRWGAPPPGGAPPQGHHNQA
ncbi:ATP-binding cassette domain-containing protein, partial [Streptomyces sp. NPDC059278]|uniref:ATP-binding cassette domain-containing protein n=1 Tax=Streptomyces sp. NPDC059278 TaxID=3346801 RepID=UPI00368CA0B1